jgi:hypothetical protein
VLAYEAGRKHQVRVNTISAGPLGSRAAKAIGFIDDMIRYSYANAPVQKELAAQEVGGFCLLLGGLLGSYPGFWGVSWGFYRGGRGGGGGGGMIRYSHANAPVQNQLSAREAGLRAASRRLSKRRAARLVRRHPILVAHPPPPTPHPPPPPPKVGNVAAFLCSPLASAVTGACVYVDNGLNTMGLATDSKTLLERDS